MSRDLFCDISNIFVFGNAGLRREILFLAWAVFSNLYMNTYIHMCVRVCVCLQGNRLSAASVGSEG